MKSYFDKEQFLSNVDKERESVRNSYMSGSLTRYEFDVVDAEITRIESLALSALTTYSDSVDINDVPENVVHQIRSWKKYYDFKGAVAQYVQLQVACANENLDKLPRVRAVCKWIEEHFDLFIILYKQLEPYKFYQVVFDSDAESNLCTVGYIPITGKHMSFALMCKDEVKNFKPRKLTEEQIRSISDELFEVATLIE